MKDQKTGKKILVIDNEKSSVEELSAKLSSAGYTVLQVYSGEEGLNSALENKPDLILLDILMPGEDGVQIVTKLREDEWGKTANIIMLTNVSASEPRVLDCVVNCDPLYYLVKSETSLDNLLEKIQTIWK